MCINPLVGIHGPAVPGMREAYGWMLRSSLARRAHPQMWCVCCCCCVFLGIIVMLLMGVLQQFQVR